MRGECTCWQKYPNKFHKNHNGSWICVDKYECVHDLEELTNSANGKYFRKTKCKKKSTAQK